MFKNTVLLSILMISGLANVQAQNGKENVEKLCGCFSVNFKYAETFSPENSYKYHDREEMNATELVLPIVNTENKVVMQHLLVIQDSMIVKHWREEWVYESPVLYEYLGDRVWKKKELPAAEVKNKWTQTVWEVSDEPRYQGVSSWIKTDGKVIWENTADAPLPRREYTVRNDYNVMRRRNRIVITDDGYMHEQDNDKIQREGKDKLIAQEKGYNTYYKMDDSHCAVAKEWWKKNDKFWNIVRSEWTAYVEKTPTIKMKAKVDDKMLNEHFMSLWAEWRSNKIKSAELDSKVKEIMAKFLQG